MKSENKSISQLDKANAALRSLKGNVTASDRKAAFEAYSEVTVIKYLKGQGKDLDTAVALLSFFREKIENREQLIRA